MMNWQPVIVCAGLLAFSLADAAEVLHPQEEALEHSSKPYTDQDVAFGNEAAHINLAATFSVPNGKRPFPAVLLIAASGPEGRDEEVQGHHVFVVLSDYLLKRGIAVLRYDKRGVGKSAGDWNKATFDDLVADADAAFQYLKGRPEVNRRRLGVIGHSEGGSIAPAVAATDKDVAFVVAIAGSGLSGKVRILRTAGLHGQRDARRVSGASGEHA
jgi:uncharacterized protein